MVAICMYPDNLFIEGIVVNENIEISGWVVNGQWYYKEASGTAYSMRNQEDDITDAVNSWKITSRKIVVVRDKYLFVDYNNILEKHLNFKDESENLLDTVDVLYIEEYNTRDRSFDYDLDQIPF